MLCSGLLIGSNVIGSQVRYLQAGSIEVNFDKSTRRNKPSGIDNVNDPEPSDVGFFNGDMDRYDNDILAVYPKGSCMFKCSYANHNQNESETIVDDSEFEQGEHYSWDAGAHQKISESFGTTPDLQDRSIKATNIRNLSKTICCWGMGEYFFPARKFSTVEAAAEDQALTEKVKTVREKKYLALKKENKETFLKARNAFVTFVGEGADENQIKNELEVAYNELKDKVQLKMTANRLTKEARWYQAGIALQVLAVGTAIYNRKALAGYASYGLAKFMSLKK